MRSAAAGDALDGSTVHYGVLSKNILAALTDVRSGAVWMSGLGVASAVSEAVVATAAVGAVEGVRMDVGFPKASTLGSGAGVEWTVLFGEGGAEVVGLGRQLYVRGVRVPVLIGVNKNERAKKQLVVVSVWVDKVSDAAIDGYDVVEDLVLKVSLRSAVSGRWTECVDHVRLSPCRLSRIRISKLLRRLRRRSLMRCSMATSVASRQARTSGFASKSRPLCRLQMLRRLRFTGRRPKCCIREIRCASTDT